MFITIDREELEKIIQNTEALESNKCAGNADNVGVGEAIVYFRHEIRVENCVRV